MDNAFAQIRHRAETGDSRFIEIATVLAAVEDVVHSRTKSVGGDSPAAFFAALMAALETAEVDLAEKLFYLLAIVLPRVPDRIVESMRSQLVDALGAVLSSPDIGSNATLLTPTLKCLGRVLTVAEPSKPLWQSPEMQRHVQALLVYAIDTREGIRRLATSSLTSILTKHQIMKFHEVSNMITQFVDTALVEAIAPGRELTQAIQIMLLLRTILPLLPSAAFNRMLEALLSVRGARQPRLTIMAFRVVETVLENIRTHASYKLLSQVINAVIEQAPAVEDYGSAAACCRLLAQVVQRMRVEGSFGTMTNADIQAHEAMTVRVARCCTNYLVSSNRALAKSAGESLVRVIECALPKPLLKRHLIADPSNTSIASDSTAHFHPSAELEELCAVVNSVTEYARRPGWVHSIPAIAELFAQLGQPGIRAASPLMDAALGHTVDLRQTVAAARETAGDVDPDFLDEYELRSAKRRSAEDQADDDVFSTLAVVQQLDMAIGAAARAYGVARFMYLVPLASSAPTEKTPAGVLNDARTWLIPILRENFRHATSQLAVFTGPVLSMARALERAAQVADKQDRQGDAKTYRMRVMLLWSLFPSFCCHPTDITTSFNVSLGKLLTRALEDKRYPELQYVVASGLANLIRGVKPPQAPSAPTNTRAHGRANSIASLGGQSMRSGRSARSSLSRMGSLPGTRPSQAPKSRRKGRGGEGDAASQAGMTAGSMRSTISRAAGGAPAATPWGVRTVRFVEDEISDDNREESAQAISAFADKYLPILFHSAETMSKVATKAALVGDDEEGANVSADRAAALMDAVEAFASIAPQGLVSSMYARLHAMVVEGLQKLGAMADASGTVKLNEDSLEVVTKCVALLSLAIAVAPSLSDEHVDSLYQTVRPAIVSDASAPVQKRGYRLLEVIAISHPSLFVNDDRLHEILGILQSSLQTVTAASKRSRLHCLLTLVDNLDMRQQQHTAAIPQIIGEVIMCTKDTNRRVRHAAFDLLLAIGDSCVEAEERMIEMDEDESKYPHALTIQGLLRLIVAGLGSAMPHMRSAVMIALARMIFEFADEAEVRTATESLLGSGLVLMGDEHKEVVKSALGFLKVAISVVPNELVKRRMAELLSGLLDSPAEAFRSGLHPKIKTILEKFVRKYGVKTVREAMPDGHEKLFTYIRRQHQRKKKKKALADGADIDASSSDEDEAALSAKQKAYASRVPLSMRKAVQSKQTWANGSLAAASGRPGSGGRHQAFDELLDSDMEDDELGEEARMLMRRKGGGIAGITSRAGGGGGRKAKRAAKKGTGTWLMEDMSGETAGVIDFLDTGAAAKSVVGVDPVLARQAKVLRAQTDEQAGVEVDPKTGRLVVKEISSDDEAVINAKREAGYRVKRKARPGVREREAAAEGGARRSMLAEQQVRKRKMQKAAQPKEAGAAYRSTKARGDVKTKSQKFEPFAYLPLDPRALSGHGGKTHVDRFDSVMASTHKKSGGKVKRGRGLAATKRDLP